MTTAILWFSGTGNSLATAQDLQKKLSGETTLIRLPFDVSFDAFGYEKIVIVIPVYAWGYPRIVGNELQSLNISDDIYTALVMTYGGGAGSALSVTKKRFEKGGVHLNAGFLLHLPENYPPLGGAPSQERIDELLKKSEGKLSDIIDKIENRVAGFERSSGVKELLLSAGGPLVYWFFSKMGLPRAGKKFSVNDSCTSCGICFQICPVQNIEMAGEKPIFGSQCEQCFACFHWCPTQAIQYGKTEKQTRYHHPNVKLSQFIRREY